MVTEYATGRDGRSSSGRATRRRVPGDAAGDRPAQPRTSASEPPTPTRAEDARAARAGLRRGADAAARFCAARRGGSSRSTGSAAAVRRGRDPGRDGDPRQPGLAGGEQRALCEPAAVARPPSDARPEIGEERDHRLADAVAPLGIGVRESLRAAARAPARPRRRRAPRRRRGRRPRRPASCSAALGALSPSTNARTRSGGSAPTNSSTTCPFRNAFTAGMPRTPNSAASA